MEQQNNVFLCFYIITKDKTYMYWTAYNQAHTDFKFMQTVNLIYQ